MKIGDMTGQQILDAIARALEESGRPFEKEEQSDSPQSRFAMAELAEDASEFKPR